MSEFEIEKENVIQVLRTVYNIFDEWGMSEIEQMKVLGISGITYEQFREPEFIQVDQDLIKRLSYILGIYKNLQILLTDAQAAGSWVNRPNTAMVFNGKPPLERMVTGDLQDLSLVHQFLNAISHGN